MCYAYILCWWYHSANTHTKAVVIIIIIISVQTSSVSLCLLPFCFSLQFLNNKTREKATQYNTHAVLSILRIKAMLHWTAMAMVLHHIPMQKTQLRDWLHATGNSIAQLKRQGNKQTIHKHIDIGAAAAATASTTLYLCALVCIRMDIQTRNMKRIRKSLWTETFTHTERPSETVKHTGKRTSACVVVYNVRLAVEWVRVIACETRAKKKVTTTTAAAHIQHDSGILTEWIVSSRPNKPFSIQTSGVDSARVKWTKTSNNRTSNKKTSKFYFRTKNTKSYRNHQRKKNQESSTYVSREKFHQWISKPNRI